MATRRWMAGVLFVAAVIIALARGDQCSTLEENVNYAGNDIQTIDQTTPDGCCNACLSSPPCAMYIYSNGWCWLKSAMTGKRSREMGKHAGFVHRWAKCGTIVDDAETSGGTLLATTNRTRAERCCLDCAATVGCAVWKWANSSWVEDGQAEWGQCLLLTAGAYLSSKISPSQRAGKYVAYVPTPAPPTTPQSASTRPSLTTPSSSGPPPTFAPMIAITIVLSVGS